MASSLSLSSLVQVEEHANPYKRISIASDEDGKMPRTPEHDMASMYPLMCGSGGTFVESHSIGHTFGRRNTASQIYLALRLGSLVLRRRGKT